MDKFNELVKNLYPDAEYIESGETDMGGFSISGPIVSCGKEVGWWGPFRHECKIKTHDGKVIRENEL